MKRIIIDAGHGPHTPGKRSPDGILREFHFNSFVAGKVKEKLVSEGLSVIFTHDELSDVPLEERIQLANNLKGDAFISIHANAFGNGWNEANGIETFTFIRSRQESIALAKLTQQAVVLGTGRKNRGIKQADFAVLRKTDMPAILVECGFMTNREECNLLMSEAYRLRCAWAISFALLCWINEL